MSERNQTSLQGWINELRLLGQHPNITSFWITNAIRVIVEGLEHYAPAPDQPAALSHEIWAAAQLLPDEGIEDGVQRIQALLSRDEPDQPAAELPQPGHERYRVEPTNGGFWPYKVLCGTGTRELFIGQKKNCEKVAMELAAAYEDGRFVEMTQAQAEPVAEHVAIVNRQHISGNVEWLDPMLPDGTKLYTRPQLAAVPDSEIDRHLDAVLKASGSALRHYTLNGTVEKMRAAMRSALAADLERNIND